MSNTVLQTLRALIRAVPPKGHRLFVIGTTSRRSVLQQLDFSSIFTEEIAVPSLRSLPELETVLMEQGIFQDPAYLSEAMNRIAEATPDGQVNVGIRKILEIAELVKSAPDHVKVDWLADKLQVAIANRYGS